MQFTKKEMELARQMKEAGLEWAPMFGDVVLYHTDIMVVWYSAGKFIVCIPQEVERGVDGKGEYCYQSHYNLIPRDVVWLPLWHQCREVMLGEGWHLTLIETPPQVEWRVHLVYERISDEKTYCIEATGHTDLEALYKAIGFLKKEGIENENVKNK